MYLEEVCQMIILKNCPLPSLVKIRSTILEFLHADRKTDRAKVIGAFLLPSITDTPKTEIIERGCGFELFSSDSVPPCELE